MPNRSISKLNLPIAGAFNAGAASAETADVTPIAIPAISAPSGLSLTTASERSASTPTALVQATWQPPVGIAPSGYTVQVASDAAFATIVTGMNVPAELAVFHGLKAGTLYFVRVAAIAGGVVGDWSIAASITTTLDLVAPAAVVSVAWQWLANGDLVLTWIDPDSENYKDAEVRIYTSAAKTLQLRTLYGRTGVVYTAAMNIADTAGVPVAAVYVEVYSRSYNDVYGPVALPTSNPFKARPATPSGLTSSWSGDTGLAAADCVLSWANQSDAIRYRLTIDGAARDLAATVYTYTYDANRTDHANTADPSLAISLVAVDGLNQTSATPATLTPVNARPPSTTATIAPGFNTLGVAIVASQAADVAQYILRVIKDGATVATLRTPATTEIVDLSNYGSGSYQLGVSVADLFAQVSAETLSTAVAIEPLTLADLRADATYTDDMGTPSSTLDVLKDNNLVSGGMLYI